MNKHLSVGFGGYFFFIVLFIVRAYVYLISMYHFFLMNKVIFKKDRKSRGQKK